MRRWSFRLLVLACVVYGPLLYLRLTTPIVTPEEARPADAAIVFGAVVREGRISALHAERLDAAISLFQNDVVKSITVSNAQRAAETMRDYLLEHHIPPSAIQLDGAAIATPDTCLAEFQRPTRRPVILISQRYHLPRIALQCAGYRLEAQFITAERGRANPEIGLAQRLWIRLRRHTREALLVWSEMLGLYRTLSSWKEGR